MAVGTPYLIGGNSIPTGATSIVITVATNTTAGDAIVVSGATAPNSASQMPLTCSDTQNNLYLLLNSYSLNGGDYQYVCLGSNQLTTTGNGGSPDKITIAYASNGLQNKNAVAIGCSGVSSVNALDQATVAANISPGSTGPSVTSPAQLQSGDLAVGLLCYGNGGGTPVWAGGWTVQATEHTSPTSFCSVATQVISGSGAVTASATIGTSPWVALVLTLSAGPNISGVLNAQVGFCASLAQSQVGSGSFSSTISFSASMNNVVSLTNSWRSKAVSNYGLDPIPVTNVTGRGLMAFVAWNGAEINPVSNLADDAHNFWTHLGTTSLSGDIRCAMWACPNAQAANIVSVGLTWFAQGLTVLIAEMAGFPNWISVDGTVITSFNNSATSLTLTGSAAAQGDVSFVLCSDGNNTAVPTLPAGPWHSIGKVTVNDPNGAGGPADTGLQAYWQQLPSGAVPSATFTSGTAIPLAGILVSLSLTPTSPVQKNPNMPGIHHEAAFGYTPGDPTVMPVWTDITARVIGDSGEQPIQSQRGRQYESEGPESGQHQLQLDNHDGAFTPGNASSPYFPNVVLGTPVRSWGTWNNRAYAIGSGYIERFPQTWPDGLTQYGLTPMIATDALDALSNSQMPSAFGGELLSDEPYGYWSFGDTYQQNQASGMPFANLSRTNQRPFIGEDGVSLRPDGNPIFSRLQTGISWNTSTTIGQVQQFLGLPGDNSTAIGVTNFSGDTSQMFTGGAYYSAPDLPQPGNGITLEFWAIVPGLQSTSRYQELLRISGPASNYYIGAGGGATNAYARGARFLARVNPGAPGTQGEDFLYIDFSDFEGNDWSHGVQCKIADDTPHHFVFQISESGGSNYKLTTILDGVIQSTVFSSGVNVENDWNFIGVGGVTHVDGGLSWGFNYTLGHLVLFPMQLANSRVMAHYAAAAVGGSGDDSVTRAAKLFTYGGFGLQRACAPASPSPILGPADQIQGTSVVDSFTTMAQAEGGVLFCDAANNATWWPRQFLFNRGVKWTLGDGPGETPYDPGEQYDFDNTFIQNAITVQRQISQNSNGVTAVAADLPSQKQYFTRNNSQQSVETTSDEDAYDQANWQLAKYRQPSLRVQQVVLDPEALPSIWPVALGIEQGDIVRLNRRPLGGAVISQLCIVEMVSHAGGPDNWKTTINLVPYVIENAVLQCDIAGYDTVASNGIAW